MPARLTMIIPTLVQGGAEKQMSLLATGLPRDQFQVSVCVLTHSGPWQEYLEDHGIPVTHISKRLKLDPIALARLTRHLKKERPDLVHTWIFAANTYGRLAARWAGVPRIVAGERCVDLWKSEGHFWLDRQLAKFTDKLVTNSSGVVDFYAQHGIPSQKFQVIPNGYQPPLASQDTLSQDDARTAWRRKLGLPDDAKMVVTLARLWPQKRIKDVIWSLDLAGCTVENLHLVVAGDGPEANDLHDFSQETRTDQSVHFVGHLNDASSLLQAADAFILASEYEGQSNSLMEAIGRKVPAIVSDIPGNLDLIPDNEHGYVFKMGDRAGLAKAIREALEHPKQSAQRAEIAFQRLTQQFQLPAMIDRYAELYQALLQKRS